MEAEHTENYKGIDIKIYPDEHSFGWESPRDWGVFGTMKCFHSRYNLGDSKAGENPIEEIISILNDNGIEFYEDDIPWEMSHNESVDFLLEKLEKIALVKDLYLYDHSGITMNTTGFSCSWDSGKVGFIYVTKDKVRQEFGVKRITKKVREKAYKILDGEVEVYDQYLTGDVWGFVVEDPDGYVKEDSCWGFYGFDGCLEEARHMAKWMYKEKLKMKAQEMVEIGKASLRKLRDSNLVAAVTTA